MNPGSQICTSTLVCFTSF